MSNILEAFLNTLWQTGAIALLAWAVLRWTPRINAATREAVWWAVLAFVILLPVVRACANCRAKVRFPSVAFRACRRIRRARKCACTRCHPATTARNGAGDAALRFVDHACFSRCGSHSSQDSAPVWRAVTCICAA